MISRKNNGVWTLDSVASECGTHPSYLRDTGILTIVMAITVGNGPCTHAPGTACFPRKRAAKEPSECTAHRHAARHNQLQASLAYTEPGEASNYVYEPPFTLPTV